MLQRRTVAPATSTQQTTPDIHEDCGLSRRLSDDPISTHALLCVVVGTPLASVWLACGPR
jgi:hypothetical protein